MSAAVASAPSRSSTMSSVSASSPSQQQSSRLSEGAEAMALGTEDSKPANAATTLTETTLSNNKSADATTLNSNNNGGKPSPLPPELRRILLEVAQTGQCSYLAWNSQRYHRRNSSHSSSAQDAVFPAAAAIAEGARSNSASTSGGVCNKRLSRPFRSAFLSSPSPSRNKHRNGLLRGGSGNSSNRKRPLVNATTTTATTTATMSVSEQRGGVAGLVLSANTIGSGGGGSSVAGGSTGTASGPASEADPYECDSEGTLSTTNSEMSLENGKRRKLRVHHHMLGVGAGLAAANSTSGATRSAQRGGASRDNSESAFVDLKHAFATAVSLVLDHFYKYNGGYKLSPAEKRRNETLMNEESTSLLSSAPVKNDGSWKETTDTTMNGGPATENDSNNNDKHERGDKKPAPLSPEKVFKQRRHRLLLMLGQETPYDNSSYSKDKPPPSPSPLPPHTQALADDGPPFTIQRISEVLVDPERFYTQTHKLCNCLEKLLLVTSSDSAFGGITGGDTSQSRREIQELAALADERGRLHSEFRQRRLRRRTSPDNMGTGNEASRGTVNARDGSASSDSKNKEASPEKKKNDAAEDASSSASTEGAKSSREMLEAAARASLRTKFDHVGIDPHSSLAVANRDVQSIGENRSMTNSPPPPSLAIASAPAIALPHSGIFPDHGGMARLPSPILFNNGSLDGPNSPTQLVAALQHNSANTQHHLLPMHHNHSGGFAGVSSFELNAAGLNHHNNEGGGANSSALRDVDVESRSSASSDMDSESDDVSFDDSASDRSDGSDSGSAAAAAAASTTQHYEPFSAARAMALNRMQQQQRLRLHLSSSSSPEASNNVARPPADTEYQSGDSIDSMRAEDSGGSDSSSSDMTD